MLCRWCHLPLWFGQTFSVKVTFFVPLVLCVLQEAREGLREAMAKDAVTLNAELSGEFNVSCPVLEDEDGDTLQNDTTTFGTLSSGTFCCPISKPKTPNPKP